jgi:hypothetical protein
VFCHAQYWWSLLRGSASMVWGILPLSLNHLSSVCRVSVECLSSVVDSLENMDAECPTSHL